jgi:hypothetical protein
MKYDLIEPINEALSKKNTDTKNIIKLNEGQRELLELVLKQRLPQLDGLQFVDLSSEYIGYFFDKEELDEMRNNKSFSKAFNVIALENRLGDRFSLYLSDDEIVLKSNGYFYLKIKKFHEDELYEYKGKFHKYTYSFNFTYGDDIICINKEIQMNSAIINTEIYLNVTCPDNTEKIDLHFVKPIKLLPDISVCGREKKDTYEGDYSFGYIDVKENFIAHWVNTLTHVANNAHRNDEYKFRKK